MKLKWADAVAHRAHPTLAAKGAAKMVQPECSKRVGGYYFFSGAGAGGGTSDEATSETAFHEPSACLR